MKSRTPAPVGGPPGTCGERRTCTAGGSCTPPRQGRTAPAEGWGGGGGGGGVGGEIGMAVRANRVGFDGAWAGGAAPLPELPKSPPPQRPASEIVRPEASIVNVEVSAMPTPKE